MAEKYTVGQLKELLSKYDDDVMVSIEDMDGNAFYTDEFAEHLDGDSPSIELLLPIYIYECAIEPDCEGSVFLNRSTVKVVE